MSYWLAKHRQLLSKHPGGGHDQKSHGNWATGSQRQFTVKSTSSASRAVGFFADALGVEHTSAKGMKHFTIPAGTTKERYLGAMEAGKAEALRKESEYHEAVGMPDAGRKKSRRQIAANFNGLRRSIESQQGFAEDLRLGDWEGVT